jgi:hypothetical protein
MCVCQQLSVLHLTLKQTDRSRGCRRHAAAFYNDINASVWLNGKSWRNSGEITTLHPAGQHALPLPVPASLCGVCKHMSLHFSQKAQSWQVVVIRRLACMQYNERRSPMLLDLLTPYGYCIRIVASSNAQQHWP